MKKSLMLKIILSLTILIFLVSCNKVPAGETPGDTAAAINLVKTGTRGVELNFLSNLPPTLIYDQNELVSLIEVKNKGNYDLKAQDCFVHISGFDQNIIRGGLQTVRSCAEGINVLEGKNVYNTEGSFNQLEFTSQSISLPPGVFEYSPTLNYQLCYNYHTTASPAVCVDPLFYQISSEQKSCTPTNVGMSGGQGGPVGVSYVGVNMVGNKANFEITLQNFGSGNLLSPYADIRNCGQGLEYKDLNKVSYNVQLSGGSLINCKPTGGIVTFNNNQGKIVCSFDIQGSSDFETPLIIDLDYSYMDSYRKDIKIVKTPE